MAVVHIVLLLFCRRDSQEDDAAPRSAEVVQLCLWSLNPAMAFRDLARGAHSLILTAGTLAPMDTFASEVGRHAVVANRKALDNEHQRACAVSCQLGPSTPHSCAGHQHERDRHGIARSVLLRHLL